jgi:hypothetical protein
MRNVRVLLCSSDIKACLTAYWTFKGQLSGVLTMLPWEDLKNCPLKEQYAKKLVPNPDLPTKKALLTTLKRGNGRGFCVMDNLVHEGWELKLDEEHMRARRAEHVRKDLYSLAKIVSAEGNGGKWKDMTINPGKLAKTVVDSHIVIISHNNFLNLLTHREGLPGELPTPFICVSTNKPQTQHLGKTFNTDPMNFRRRHK